MKYIILLGDGMADYPIENLGGKTPLAVARIPNMDRIAGEGTIGLVDTIPAGFKPGSDVANLSVLGYDPGSAIPAEARSKRPIWVCRSAPRMWHSAAIS